MATQIQNAYKDATLTFTDDKITWHCPHPTNHGAAGTYEVMMGWEQPIMEKMAELAVSEGDHVLECGFGMGILSNAIQARNPASHTICEFHPQVIEKAKAWAVGKSNVTIHEDKWWSLYGTTGRYDAILMDTYADDDLHAKFRMFCTAKIVKTGGKITWWNFSGGDSDEYMKFYWTDGVTFTDVSVDPPMNSYYNKDIYKVPLKTLTPPATGRGIVSDVTVNMPDSITKEIEAIHNHSIVTCADVSNPSLVNQTCGRTLVMVCKGVYNINNGLLKVTGNHPMIIKRDGSWVEKNMNELVVGDKLYKIDNTEIEITSIDFDSSDTRYTIARVLIDHNYFVNNILMKGGSDG
tara:strand:+ start:3303 stop:4352 length:1050 start_codon:yes stop_codon:yes gene_type:complete